MTRQPLDDAEIAQLVHDAADGWTMPPVRLDAPAWRERVRSPRARRTEALRGWLAPLGRAASGALALTVAAALIAVMVTSSPNDPGKSPGSSDGSTPGASDSARPSPLPNLLKNGELPSPSEVLVRTEPFTFAIVDLSDGTIGPRLIAGAPGSELQLRSDGTMVCLCVTESGISGSGPATRSIRLDRLDASGAVTSSEDVASFTGAADPRDADRPARDSVPNVLTSVSFSEADRFGIVGWSYREDPSWKSGLLVVDLRTTTIVSRHDLPDVSSGEGDARTILEAPRVVGQEGDELIVGRAWATTTNSSFTDAPSGFDVDAFRVPFPGGVLGEPAAIPGMTGCGDAVRFGGVLPSGGTWLVCTRGETFQTRLRRVSADGGTLPDVVVSGEPGIEGDASAISRDGRTLFTFDPASGTLTRVDTATGEVSTGHGRLARADAGPLVAIGRWIAPPAAAKTFLESSVVLSPDGSRVYALGVKQGVEDQDIQGSAGVFVFDSSTLDVLGTYRPTADFVSIAIEPSGRYLYAAGLPGFNELGERRVDQGSSITVFDTTDGSVRLIAGQLGAQTITFNHEPMH